MKSNKKNGINFWSYFSVIVEKLLDSGLFPAVIASLILILSVKYKDLSTSFSSKEYLPFIVAGAVLFLIFINYLFKFLANDREKKSESISTLLQRFRDLERQKGVEESIKEALSKNPEILNVEKTVYDNILSNLENSLINKLDERFKNNIRTEFISNSIINELNPLTKNVEKYIDRIQRNSIVNLFIGILGTVTAITILAFSILTNKTFLDLQSFIIHFLPRFTFVIFIQLFAFFFLRLYKNNLEDAKYFQNELTNLTAKSSSIKISYLMGDTDKVYEILKDLSVIERNFKLLKDETTVGLEKAKLENNLEKSMIDQMKDLLSKYEAKK